MVALQTESRIERRGIENLFDSRCPYESVNVTKEGGEKTVARGSIVKKSGSYYAVYRVDGKQKWEIAGRTKAMADKLLTRRMDQINSGEYCEIEPKRFEVFSELWLKDYALPNVKQSTYTVYAHTLKKYVIPAMGGKHIHRLTALDIQSLVSALLTEHGLSEKSSLNAFTLLRTMFKQAKLWGLIRKDPTEGLKRPRVPRKEMDFLTSEELALLIEHSSNHYRLLFTMAAMTGLRQGELLGLSWGDINWKTFELIVRRSLYQGKFVPPKTVGSTRRVCLSPKLLEALRDRFEAGLYTGGDLVFQTPSGTPVNAKNLVRREFHPALDRAGVRRVRFHDLRHTFASLLIEQGENVKFVQQQLGHSSAKMTLDQYGHLMPGTRIDAGLKLDKTVFGSQEKTVVRNLLESTDSGSRLSVSTSPEVVNLHKVKASGDG